MGNPSVLIMLIVGIYLMLETNASDITTKGKGEKNCCFGKKKEQFTLREQVTLKERNLENELNEIKKAMHAADMEYESKITQLESVVQEKIKHIKNQDKLIAEFKNISMSSSKFRKCSLESVDSFMTIEEIKDDKEPAKIPVDTHKIEDKSVVKGHKIEDKIDLDEEKTSENPHEIILLKIQINQLQKDNKCKDLIIEKLQKHRQRKELDPTYIGGKAIVHPIVVHLFKISGRKGVGQLQYITSIIQKFVSPFGVPSIHYKEQDSDGDIVAMHLSHDNSFLFTADENSRLKVWNLQTGVCIRELHGPGGIRDQIFLPSIQVSKDDRLLHVKSYNGREYVFQKTWNQLIEGYSVERFHTLSMWRTFAVSSDPVSRDAPTTTNYVLAETRDNQYFLAQTDTNRITAWFLNDGTHYRDFYFANGVPLFSRIFRPTNFLKVTNDGKWLVVVIGGRNTKIITLWNFLNGELTNEKIFYDVLGIYHHTEPKKLSCITTDDQWIMISMRQTVKICNLPHMDKIYNLESSHTAVGSIRDGQNLDGRIVAVGPDLVYSFGYIEVWLYQPDFRHGRKMHHIPFFGRTSVAYSLSFDGKIICVSDLYCIRVWNTNSGKLFDYYDVQTVTNDNAEEN